LKITAITILLSLFIGLSGCRCGQNFGELSTNLTRRETILNSYKSPEASEVTFQSLIHWGGHEIFLIEVVKVLPQGGFSVAGVSDIGKTLYSAQIEREGKGRIISNALPVSERWLMENLITELLIPWNGPDETYQLYQISEGRWAMVNGAEDDSKVFIFDKEGKWLEYRRILNCRLKCRESVEWAEKGVPKVIRVDNFEKNYNIVRESISVAP
jgi:hypothetical protein